MPIQYNTTRHGTISRWQITILHCPALCPSPASSFSLSLSFFLPLSISLSLSLGALLLLPLPLLRWYCTWCSLVFTTVHSACMPSCCCCWCWCCCCCCCFYFFLDTSTGCFFLFPGLASLRSAVSRLSSPRLSSPLSASIIGLHRLAWLWLLLLLFSSLLYFLFHSIVFYSAVFLFRQRHRLPHSVLQRLRTTHLLTSRQTQRQIGHDMTWCDVMWWSTVPCTCTDLTWPDLCYVTWPDLTLPYLTAISCTTILYSILLDLTWSEWRWYDTM